MDLEDARLEKNRKQREYREANKDRVREWKKRSNEKRKEANAEYRKLWYAKNRERAIAYSIEYAITNKEKVQAKRRAYKKKYPERHRAWIHSHWERNREQYLYMRIRRTCNEKGLEFDLTKDWIRQRLDDGICEMSGLPFDMGSKGNFKRGPNTPSVDRINPFGGYTMDNCRMILWFINRAMINLGEEYTLMVFSKCLERRVACSLTS
jgi:hypothetical protein